MGNYESSCRTDFGLFQSSSSVSGVVDADKQAMPLQTAGIACGTFWMIPKDLSVSEMGLIIVPALA